MTLDPATLKVFLASGRCGDTPAPTADHLSPHPNGVPNSFMIVVAEPK